MANQRKDFLHKETSRIVQSCALLATEELSPKNMSQSAKSPRHKRQKAGLNREVRRGVPNAVVQSGRNWHDTAFGQHLPT